MFRDHSIVYNINQGETSHTISYARSKKKSEMISDIRRKIAVCNARLQNKFGNFTKEELVKTVALIGGGLNGTFVITEIQTFLEPVFDAIVNEKEWQEQWNFIMKWNKNERSPKL